MSAKKTQKKASNAGKASKAPKKPEDPRRFQVFYNDPVFGRRQAYPGSGVDIGTATHLSNGLRFANDIVLVPGTDPNDTDS